MFGQASTASILTCGLNNRALLRGALAGLALGLSAGLAPGLVSKAAASSPPPVDQSASDYRDDRSTGALLIRSLYNAINRHEFLRAWSYFGEAANPPSFEDFAKGYEKTDHVRLKLGRVREEGAAGSTFTNVPAAIEAIDRDGKKTVFSGCYVTRLVQPAIQETPPFAPLHIEKATLKKVSRTFDAVKPTCPDQ